MRYTAVVGGEERIVEVTAAGSGYRVAIVAPCPVLLVK